MHSQFVLNPLWAAYTSRRLYGVRAGNVGRRLLPSPSHYNAFDEFITSGLANEFERRVSALLGACWQQWKPASSPRWCLRCGAALSEFGGLTRSKSRSEYPSLLWINQSETGHSFMASVISAGPMALFLPLFSLVLCMCHSNYQNSLNPCHPLFVPFCFGSICLHCFP